METLYQILGLLEQALSFGSYIAVSKGAQNYLVAKILQKAFLQWAF